MVRALLAGTKTQTRRILTPQPSASVRESVLVKSGFRNGHGREIKSRFEEGDRLWVRETWARNWNLTSDDNWRQSHVYRADCDVQALDNGTEIPWRPSIYMPRAASRLTLIVTGVRIHRAHAITEADAIAEGVKKLPGNMWSASDGLIGTSPQAAFLMVWDAVNGKYSSYLNPWVYAVSFNVERKNIDA
jgi:hypothetical protein